VLRPRAKINLLAERTVGSLRRSLEKAYGRARPRLDGDAHDCEYAHNRAVPRRRATDPARLGVRLARATRGIYSGVASEPPATRCCSRTAAPASRCLRLVIAVSIATGLGLLGDSHIPTLQGNVLYLDWEADEQDSR